MYKIRIALLAGIVTLAFGSPSPSQEFLLNCRLLTFKDPLFSQHCKSVSRCREGDCLRHRINTPRRLKARKRATIPQDVQLGVPVTSGLQAPAAVEDGALQSVSAPAENTSSASTDALGSDPGPAEANSGGPQPASDTAAGSTEGNTGGFTESGGAEGAASSGAEGSGSESAGGDTGSEAGGSDSGGDSGGVGSNSGGDSGGGGLGGEDGDAGSSVDSGVTE